MTRIAAGGLASGALALGTAVLLKAAVGTEEVGPTAATLSDGPIAVLLGYALILAPTLIATAPSDVSVPESISTAALGTALITPAILLGAAIGAGFADYRKTHLYRRPR
jgi:hypothetical protein